MNFKQLVFQTFLHCFILRILPNKFPNVFEIELLSKLTQFFNFNFYYAKRLRNWVFTLHHQINRKVINVELQQPDLSGNPFVRNEQKIGSGRR